MNIYKDSYDALDSLVNCYADYYDRKEAEKLIKQDLDKLEKFKNLKEELGCPLEVVIKPLLEGGIIDNDGYGVQLNGLAINGDGSLSLTAVNGDHYDLKDYQKTWWLKGENNETL